uniref:Uncharacterized protein n=1 Tax=Ditylenchus dipsaci TaxID=166011 RepID=A0A915EJ05_9BILA
MLSSFFALKKNVCAYAAQIASTASGRRIVNQWGMLEGRGGRLINLCGGKAVLTACLMFALLLVGLLFDWSRCFWKQSIGFP